MVEVTVTKRAKYLDEVRVRAVIDKPYDVIEDTFNIGYFAFLTF